VIHQNALFHRRSPTTRQASYHLIVLAVKRKELVLCEKGLVCLGLCCLIAWHMALNSFQLFITRVQTVPEVLKLCVLQVAFDVCAIVAVAVRGQVHSLPTTSIISPSISLLASCLSCSLPSSLRPLPSSASVFPLSGPHSWPLTNHQIPMSSASSLHLVRPTQPPLPLTLICSLLTFRKPFP